MLCLQMRIGSHRLDSHLMRQLLSQSKRLPKTSMRANVPERTLGTDPAILLIILLRRTINLCVRFRTEFYFSALEEAPRPREPRLDKTRWSFTRCRDCEHDKRGTF